MCGDLSAALVDGLTALSHQDEVSPSPTKHSQPVFVHLCLQTRSLEFLAKFLTRRCEEEEEEEKEGDVSSVTRSVQRFSLTPGPSQVGVSPREHQRKVSSPSNSLCPFALRPSLTGEASSPESCTTASACTSAG